MQRLKSSFFLRGALGLVSLVGELNSQTLSHFEISEIPESITPGEEFNISVIAIGIDGQLEGSWQGEAEVYLWIPRENPVISEIDSRSDETKKLEITNPGLMELNLSGWRFLSLPHSGTDAVPTVDFTFPENTILPGQSVLTLSDAELDSMDLNTSNAWIHFVYPEPLGNGTFRKVNQLFDGHGNMVDEVVFHYLSEAWPPFAIFDSILYNSRVIYSRTGLKNNFNKSDWINGIDSFGEINPSLQLPWRNEDRWIPLEPGSVVDL